MNCLVTLVKFLPFPRFVRARVLMTCMYDRLIVYNVIAIVTAILYNGNCIGFFLICLSEKFKISFAFLLHIYAEDKTNIMKVFSCLVEVSDAACLCKRIAVEKKFQFSFLRNLFTPSISYKLLEQ